MFGGTIGWIAAGLAISYLFHWDPKPEVPGDKGLLQNTFLMVAIASAILGLFSFTLPKTPPKADDGSKITVRDILGLEALKLLKDRNFLVFFLSSVLICVPWLFITNTQTNFSLKSAWKTLQVK